MSDSTHGQSGDISPSIERNDTSSGNLDGLRPIPRITIHAFCETDAVAKALDMAAQDRRMLNAHLNIRTGGISSATGFYANTSTPNLIIVETGKSGTELTDELALLAEVCETETKVAVIGSFNDIIMYRDLINRGVSEYLVAPVTMTDILSMTSRIYSDSESGKWGRSIAFIGAKGGSGSSTLCHNAAWSISSIYQTDVILADMDMAFGTASINLDQDLSQGMNEALHAKDHIDDIMLDRLLAKCSEHFNLLAAPSALEEVYDLDKKSFNQLIEVAQRGAPYVIMDLPQQWTAWVQEIVSRADEVVITACPDLANLRNVKNLVDRFSELRPNDARPKLILNQVGIPKRPEISIKDFTSPLDIEPLAVVPFEPALFGNAANNGQMISEIDARHTVSNCFRTIAQILTGKTESGSPKDRGFNIRELLKFKK